MQNIFKTFIKHTIFSGIFIGIIMVLLEFNFFKLSGFIYGALPIGFIYIILNYYFKNIHESNKINIITNLTYFTILGGFIFILIMFIYYYTLIYSNNLIISKIALILACIITVFLFIQN
jgi:hypothetical protein